MIEDIYKAGPLSYPKVVQVDNGTEFKADVTRLLESKGVIVRKATTKYHHTFTAYVEAYNKELAKDLFRPQDAQELEDPEKVATTWVKYLYKTVTKMNNTKTAMIGIKPNQAIKMKDVPLVKAEAYPKEKLLPEDGLFLYLLQSGEEHGDQRRRATDAIWSKKPYRFDRIIEEPAARVLYYLDKGPDRAFVREELMLIPEDVQVPPKTVQQW